MSDDATSNGWLHLWGQRLQAAAGDEREDVLAQAAVALETLPENVFDEELQRSGVAEVGPLGDLLRREWSKRRGAGATTAPAPMPPAFELDAAEFRALGFAQRGGAEGLEMALQIFQSLLGSFSPGEDFTRWTRLQHQLAETYTKRNGGTRAQNLECAIAAFRAALPGRSGEGRVFTLLGLCQALRQRMAGDPEDTRREREAAIEEAERLAEVLRNPRVTARLWYERGLGLANDGELETGLELVRRSSRLAPHTAGIVAVAEAEILCQIASTDPARRSEALGAVRSLRERAVGVDPVRLASASGLLRLLGEPVPFLDVEAIENGLLPQAEDLGDGPLPPDRRRALERRLGAEEQRAFAEHLAQSLVEHESAVAPLRLRLAREASSDGQHETALGHLARLGGWRLRRALRWSDARLVHSDLELLSTSRILDDELDRLMAAEPVLVELFQNGMMVDGSALDRLRRWSDGEDGAGILTAGDLVALFAMPPDERARVAADVARGLESGIEDQLGLPRTRSARHDLLTPTMVAKDELLASLQPGEAIAVHASVRGESGLGMAWRGRTGKRRCVTTFYDRVEPDLETPTSDATEVVREFTALLPELAGDGVERVAIAGRLSAPLPAPFVSVSGLRAVHVPGFDRTLRRPATPGRERLLLVLVDQDPDANLPCIVAAADTLAAVGFEVVRPGAALDLETCLGLQRARGVILAGHGSGARGPLGPWVGHMETRSFQTLPLMGADWATCIACAAGHSLRETDFFWDKDDPGGAGEHLLLAGCAAAADCLDPIPELLGAVILEEFGVAVSRGDDPEIAFARALAGWRSALFDLTPELVSFLADAGPAGLEDLIPRLAAAVNARRQERLGRSVTPLPPNGIARRLGVRPGGDEAAAEAFGHDQEQAARQIVQELLSPFTSPATWSAFRWLARR